jgi:hypothetical protein
MLQGYPFETVAESFQYLGQRVCGKRSASNGILNLRLKWKNVAGKPMSIIRLEAMRNTPERTVDITQELQKLDRELKRMDNLSLLQWAYENGNVTIIQRLA